MFHVTRLAIADVMLLTPDVKSDHRGDFSEIYNDRDLAAAGIGDRFVVDNHVRNIKANIVRGLHFQLPPFAQAKLIRATRGRIFDVAVDIRPGSPSFGKHVGVTLDADDLKLLYIPEGFAHGFCALDDAAEVHYKVNRYPEPAVARGIRWDDPALAIAWPLTGEAILALRDTLHPTLAEFAAAEKAAGAPAVAVQAVSEIIDALEQERCRALIAKDIVALEAICSEHLVYTHTSTRRDTKLSFIRRVETGFYDYLEFIRGESKITVVGATAFVTGRLQSRVIVEGVEKHLNNAILAVWALEDGRWKFVAYQPTPIPAVVPV
jgi:dTDP-4-dehydrorhamnose 3,5-epimerase